MAQFPPAVRFFYKITMLTSSMRHRQKQSCLPCKMVAFWQNEECYSIFNHRMVVSLGNGFQQTYVDAGSK